MPRPFLYKEVLMFISELIARLEEAKDRIGDVQCVMEIQNWRGDPILTTVEDVLERKRPAHDDRGRQIKDEGGEPVMEPVAFIDWRC